MKGVIARKQIDRLREEEMIFLGMRRSPRNSIAEAQESPLFKRRRHTEQVKMV